MARALLDVSPQDISESVKTTRRIRFGLIALALLGLSSSGSAGAPQETSILPVPQQVEALPGSFKLDPSAVIALTLEPTAHDLFLAQSLSAELAQRYGLAVRTERMMALPAGPVIAIGTWQNPLIQEAERRFPLEASPRPGPEGYTLLIQPGILAVDGSDEAGAFYGLQSVRQLLAHAGPALELPGVRIHDWPSKPVRGVKLYLPGRDNIGFFRRFVSDFMALYKMNYLLVEIDGAMRFDRHPEINAGWIDLFKDMNYTRRLFPKGPGGEEVDSPNQDVADGGVLEKREVADLVSWTCQQHINFVPEMPSLTHSFYLLSRHRELADPMEAEWEWPEAYAPDDPRSHRLYLEVLDEVIAVTHPSMVHIGHDEWQVPLGTAPGTTSDDRRRQYAADIRATHDYLAARGIRTAMYGDELIEGLRGYGHLSHPATATNRAYDWPGALPPTQVAAEIPKDILIFNWFWKDGVKGKGEGNDLLLDHWGFQQVYSSNYDTDIVHYDRRGTLPSVIGGVSASWTTTTEANLSKDRVVDFIGWANQTWSAHWLPLPELVGRVQDDLPVTRQRLSGNFLPSEEGDAVEPVPLPVDRAETPAPDWGGDPATLRTGSFAVGNLHFQLADPAGQNGKPGIVVGVAGKGGTALPLESAPIPIGADVSSLIFLQALAPSGGQRVWLPVLLLLRRFRRSHGLLRSRLRRRIHRDDPDSLRRQYPGVVVGPARQAGEFSAPGAGELRRPRAGDRAGGGAARDVLRAGMAESAPWKENQGSAAARIHWLPDRRAKQQGDGEQCHHSSGDQRGASSELSRHRPSSNGSPMKGWFIALAAAAFAAGTAAAPAPADDATILTPKPAATPRLTGAAVVGARPGHPFLFTVTATGDRPLAFAASGLPEGLSLDPATGRITGAVTRAGDYRVQVAARNGRGLARRELKIVIGDTLALTPPMGWNSWNCFGAAVTEADVEAAADAFVRTGLIDHGWTYINVDDYWMTRPLADDPVVKNLEARARVQPCDGFDFTPDDDRSRFGPARDAAGRINSNRRFPDMAALASYIHRRRIEGGHL